MKMMDKKIEDYLHLYIGCNVQTPDGVRKLIGLSGLENAFVETEPKSIAPSKAYWAYHISEITPILRPLGSMTDEEMDECGNMEYDFRDDPELNKWEPSDFEIGLSPRQFHWLLSKHFDLFDLIPSGLAISSNSKSK